MFSRFRSFLGATEALFQKRTLEKRLRDELQLHIDLLAEKNILLGMSDEEARRQARIAVGGFDQVRERVCDARGVRWVHELNRDFRFALRIYGKRKALSLTVILMLALACAADTFIFGIYNSIVLRRLPFPDSERLVDINETAPLWNLETAGIVYPDFYEWRKQNRSFDAIGLYRQEGRNYSRKGEARRIGVLLVTYDFGSVFQLRPVIGRGFTEQEDRPGGPKVVMLGFGFWQREFGGSPAALGETLKLDGEIHTVVGVLPRNVVYPEGYDLWVPIQRSPADNSGNYWFSGIGRLKIGVALERAREDITRIHKSMIEARPANKITAPRLRSLRESVFGNATVLITLLLFAVVLLLLIVCVNIAGMMLARSASRFQEMGIRSALGASPAGIVKQLLTESLLLALPGVLLGVLLGIVLLKWQVGQSGDMPPWINLTPDIRFLAFCGLMLGGTTILFGLAPALQAARVKVQPTLHEASARLSASANKRRALRLLLVGEVALTFVLLVGAGLLLRTWKKVLAINPGFRANNAILYGINLPPAVYAEGYRRASFFEQLLERHRGLPGVTAATGSSSPPFTAGTGNYVEVEGAPPQAADESRPMILMNVVFPGYFEAMGIQTISGRTFTEQDGRTGGSRVAIVDESFARRFWPNVTPVGKRIRFTADSPGIWMTVVGLNRDVKHDGLDHETRPEVCIPYNQLPVNVMYMVVRSTSDPAGLLGPLRSQLHGMDADVPVANPILLREQVNQSVAGRRNIALSMALFAGAALLIATAGVYGVVSYTVSRRTHEIGIRMAVGARPGQVLGMVFRGSMRPVFAGAILGAAGALAMSRAIRSLLFGITSFDAPTYLIVAALLLGVVAGATLLPAIRAASINPARSLRSE
jgi:putative ABC transport system permease protein